MFEKLNWEQTAGPKKINGLELAGNEAVVFRSFNQFGVVFEVVEAGGRVRASAHFPGEATLQMPKLATRETFQLLIAEALSWCQSISDKSSYRVYGPLGPSPSFVYAPENVLSGREITFKEWIGGLRNG